MNMLFPHLAAGLCGACGAELLRTPQVSLYCLGTIPPLSCEVAQLLRVPQVPFYRRKVAQLLRTPQVSLYRFGTVPRPLGNPGANG